MERSFEVSEYSFGKIVHKNYAGRFIANGHRAAALKAATQIFRLHNKDTGSVSIVMYETTRNSNNQSRKYKVKRIENPKTVNVDGKRITFNYDMTAKAMSM
jgi:alpha/beta superfamily hydrolase